MATFFPEDILQQSYNSFSNPLDAAGFFNANPLSDPDWPQASMRIIIPVDGVNYDFGPYYVHKSYEREFPYSMERGSIVFKVAEFDADQNVMPFIPGAEMDVQFWDLDMDEMFARGQVVGTKNSGIALRDDGTEVAIYDVKCTNSIRYAERKRIYEDFEGITTGFLADYCIREYSFLQSNIDPASGTEIESFSANGLTLAQVLEWVLNREPSWTIKVNEKTLPYATISMGPMSENVVLTLSENGDTNGLTVDDYVDPRSLVLGPDTQAIRNKGIAIYKGLYNTGTCNVGGGGPGVSKIVYGIGTDWKPIKAGAKFRLKGATAIYTVQDNRSESYPSLKQELVLSDFYNEEQEYGVEYEVFDFPGYYEEQDDDSIKFMAAIKNETGPLAGIYEFEVPGDGGYFTREQIINVTKTYLLNYSNPLIQGGFSSDTEKLEGIDIEPGGVIYVDLKKRKQMQFYARIKNITEKEDGPAFINAAGKIKPFFRYDIDMTDRLFDVNNQIRRLQADVTRSNQRDNDNIFTGIVMREKINMYDAINILVADQDVDLATVSDVIQFTDVASGLLSVDYYTDDGTLVYDYDTNSFGLSTNA